MYQWKGESRKKLLGELAQYLHNKDIRDTDNFASCFVFEIATFIETRGAFPKELELQSLLGRLKTSLFKTTRRINKKHVVSFVADLLNSENGSAIQSINGSSTDLATKAIRISIDDITSFGEVRKIPPHEVAKLVPLKIPEAVIKQSLAEILGEPFIFGDWGGEIADFFTSHVLYKERRLATGFLLKGPAVPGTLTIKKLGKNGDQIVRLTSTSLDLYLVQFVGPIAQMVVDHLDAHVNQVATRAKKDKYYCIMDGTDTARLLKAYKKLT
jgi:hypothetical protein